MRHKAWCVITAQHQEAFQQQLLLFQHCFHYTLITRNASTRTIGNFTPQKHTSDKENKAITGIDPPFEY